MLGLLVLLVGCERGREASEPPERYKHDATVVVQYVMPDQIGTACAGAAHEPGVKVEECWKGDRVVEVNPCYYGDGNDPYAQVHCHGNAHWNGWAANHPK